MYDGKRGQLNDVVYREYIPGDDLDWYKHTGKHIVDVIFKNRERQYTLSEASGLYLTTATSGDYPYSLKFTTGQDRNIFSFTLETGREFQPNFDEALKIMEEVNAGLIEYCLACVESIKNLTATD